MGERPECYRAYRITCGHEHRDQVFAAFEGYDAIVSVEKSKDGEEHYHAITIDETPQQVETIKKRIQKLPLSQKPGHWSKKNHRNNYVFGVSYTTKDNDYVIKGTKFNEEFITNCKDAYRRHRETRDNEIKLKDTDRDWVLTFSNLVRVAQNYAAEHGMKTQDLSEVLKSMHNRTRWIPSPAMLKNGIDPYYHELYAARRDKTETPAYWDRVPIVDRYYKRPKTI